MMKISDFLEKKELNDKDPQLMDSIPFHSVNTATPLKSIQRDDISQDALKKRELAELVRKLISADVPDAEKIPYFSQANLLTNVSWKIILCRVSLECLKAAFANKVLCDKLSTEQLRSIIEDDPAKQEEALQYPYIFNRFTKDDFCFLNPQIIITSTPYNNLPLDQKQDLYSFLRNLATIKYSIS